MPPPTLPQNPRPHVENFYQNSFKQLATVQQRQVGLLVGVAVADAAARGMDGRGAEEIAEYEREALAFEREYEESMRQLRKSSASSVPGTAVAVQDVHSPIVFASIEEPRRQHLHQQQQEGRRPPAGGTAELLAFHSFSYHLYYDVLRVMSHARGEFPPHHVANKWLATAEAVAATEAEVYAADIGSLLHTLCPLLAIPTTYPYAKDEDMRAYAAPLVEMLTSVPLPEEEDAARVVELGSGPGGRLTTTVAEAHAAEQALARDMTLSALGVVIRFLQSNPDPERNGAFMALPGTGDMFTAESAAFVPKADAQAGTQDLARRRAINEALLARYSAAAAPPPSPLLLLPRRPVLRDAQTIRESFGIVKNTRSFAHGIVQAIRLGGPACQRAMLVGAMLGAKLGARQVPLPWLSATADHQPVSTMALEIAQCVWNPPPQR